MHLITVAILSAGFLGVSANPIPTAKDLTARGRPCPPCHKTTEYTVGHQFDWSSPWKLMPGYSCEGGVDGCQLNYGHEYSVGISVETGIDLGLNFDDIFNAGVSGSVSLDMEKTVTTGATLICPSDAHCGAMHQDAILIVQGYKNLMENCVDQNVCGGDGGITLISSNWYEVWYPLVTGDGTPVTDVAICVCPDSSTKPDGMPVCPESCISPT